MIRLLIKSVFKQWWTRISWIFLTGLVCFLNQRPSIFKRFLGNFVVLITRAVYMIFFYVGCQERQIEVRIEGSNNSLPSYEYPICSDIFFHHLYTLVESFALFLI